MLHNGARSATVTAHPDPVVGTVLLEARPISEMETGAFLFWRAV